MLQTEAGMSMISVYVIHRRRQFSDSFQKYGKVKVGPVGQGNLYF